jgi:uncharacterized membrane protein
MDVVTVIFGSLKIIFGFLLLLFIPGFAISLVFYPRSAELRLIERLAYSTVLSIGSVIGLVLFMDVVLGIDTTPENIFIIICGISVVALIIWGCETWYMKSSLKPRIDSLLTIDYITFRNYYSRLKDFVITRLERKKNHG